MLLPSYPLSFLLLLLHHSSAFSTTHHRRLLHHPFIPSTTTPSLPPSPSPSPSSHLTHPFSTSLPSPSSTTTPSDNNNNPFFPSYSTPPPPSQPPPSTTTALPTFPANISSLALPSSSSSSPHHSHFSPKLTLFIILLTLSLFISLSLLLLLRRRRRHHHPSKPHSPLSPPPPLPPLKIPATNRHTHTPSHTSTDFGNAITNSRDFQTSSSSAPIEVLPSSTSEIYLKLCGDSPELRPLPPLPTQNSQQQHYEPNIRRGGAEDEEFYSPRTDQEDNDYYNNYGLNSSPARTYSDSLASDSDVSVEIQTLATRTSHFPATGRMGPPAAAPPPPPPGVGPGPPPLVPPSGPVVFKSSGNLGERKSGERKSGERKEENGKPKLKVLHWDKVRATSDRVMAWDQLKPGSFQ